MDWRQRLVTPSDRLDGHRLAMLTDGIYAIILTLLVLELRIPEHLAGDAILPALKEALPKLTAFFIAFNAAATGWAFNWMFHTLLKRTNFLHLMLMLVALMLASLIPFAAAMMGDYPGSPWGYVPYCVIVGALALAYGIDALLCGPALAHPHVETAVLRAFAGAAICCTGITTSVMIASFHSTVLALWMMLIGNGICWVAVFALSRLLPRGEPGPPHG